MSLPRQHRLTEKQAFRELFQKPQVSSVPAFKVLARPNGQAGSRLGMAVSRKVDRRAVQRNRIKRLVRESFRQHIANNKEIPSTDFMILPRPNAVTISNEEVFEQLQKLWNNIARSLRQKESPVA